MDRRRAAGALLALAACIACSTAAPMASNATALDLYDGAPEGCYYNFQHYGEGDRIMTNEPCLNCTCHNRMLMCYLRVCPFTKPIGQDCTVEKRADQCCPIVTCPDVPVDLLTSTSTSSPAEYGGTGIGKQDKYGCSIDGRYFPEGSKVPPTPNKPCEHCYCIRNMTTCVMQECTLHVDGCIPIYHKDVCCPVRYSCDHPEDEIPLLDDMTTTVRPTPGFLLTTTTLTPVTQISQDCVHDDQIFADGALIKTEKACEHCYCMKGDIVCVVQECGTPMENEGKNCTSLPPRHGQCCPDTYICEGDELTTDQTLELTTEIVKMTSTTPPRRAIEGSGYRNEPDEPYTEGPIFENLDIEGSGDEQSTVPIENSQKKISESQTPDLADEMFLTTVKQQESKIFSSTTEQDMMDIMVSKSEPPSSEQTLISEYDMVTEPIKEENEEEKITDSQKKDVETPPFVVEDTKVTQEPLLTTPNEYVSSSSSGLPAREDQYDKTDSLLKEEHDVSTVTEETNIQQMQEEITTENNYYEHKVIKDDGDHVSVTDAAVTVSEDDSISIETTSHHTNIEEVSQSKQTTTNVLSETYNTEKDSTVESISTSTMQIESLETSSISNKESEIDEDLSLITPTGRIPGEGDCLLNSITYKNNASVPATNKCHTSCKCINSIVTCDPIICSPPPEYTNMNNCQPMYDSTDSCCPTYICDHLKEMVLPESHSQMSGTESPKPSHDDGCSGDECQVIEDKQSFEPSQTTVSSHSDLPLNTKIPCDGNTECQVTAVKPCEGEDCKIQLDVISKNENPTLEEKGSECKDGICVQTPSPKYEDDSLEKECNGDSCRRKENSDVASKLPSPCSGQQCESLPEMNELLQESSSQLPVTSEEIMKTVFVDTSMTSSSELYTINPTEKLTTLLDETLSSHVVTDKVDSELQDITTKQSEILTEVTDSSVTKEIEPFTVKPTVEQVPEYSSEKTFEISSTTLDIENKQDLITTTLDVSTEPSVSEENIQIQITTGAEKDITYKTEKPSTAYPVSFKPISQEYTLSDDQKLTVNEKVDKNVTPGLNENTNIIESYTTESLMQIKDKVEDSSEIPSTAYVNEQVTVSIQSKDDSISKVFTEPSTQSPEYLGFEEKIHDEPTVDVIEKTEQYSETTDTSESFDMESKDKYSTQGTKTSTTSINDEVTTENIKKEESLEDQPTEKTPQTGPESSSQISDIGLIEQNEISGTTSVIPEYEGDDSGFGTKLYTTEKDILIETEKTQEELYTKTPIIDVMESLNGRGTEIPSKDINEEASTVASQTNVEIQTTSMPKISDIDETQPKITTTEKTKETYNEQDGETKTSVLFDIETEQAITDAQIFGSSTLTNIKDEITTEVNKDVNYGGIVTTSIPDKITTTGLNLVDDNVKEEGIDEKKDLELLNETPLQPDISTKSIETNEISTTSYHKIQSLSTEPSSLLTEYDLADVHQIDVSTSGPYPDVENVTETIVEGSDDVTKEPQQLEAEEKDHLSTPSQTVEFSGTPDLSFSTPNPISGDVQGSLSHQEPTAVVIDNLSTVTLPTADTNKFITDSLSEEITTKLEETITNKPDFTIKELESTKTHDSDKTSLTSIGSEDSYLKGETTEAILISQDEGIQKTTITFDSLSTEKSPESYIDIVTDKVTGTSHVDDTELKTDIPEFTTAKISVTELDTFTVKQSSNEVTDHEENITEESEKSKTEQHYTESQSVTDSIDLNEKDVFTERTDLPTTLPTKEIVHEISETTDQILRVTEIPKLDISEKVFTEKSDQTTLGPLETSDSFEENTVNVGETEAINEYTTESLEKIMEIEDNNNKNEIVIPDVPATGKIELEPVTDKTLPPEIKYIEKYTESPDKVENAQDIRTESPELSLKTTEVSATKDSDGLTVEPNEVITVPELDRELTGFTTEPSELHDSEKDVNLPEQKIPEQLTTEITDTETDKNEIIETTVGSIEKSTESDISDNKDISLATEEVVTVSTPQFITEDVQHDKLNINKQKTHEISTEITTEISNLIDDTKENTKLDKNNQDITTEIPEISTSELPTTTPEIQKDSMASSDLPEKTTDIIVVAVSDENPTERSTESQEISTPKISGIEDVDRNDITTESPESFTTSKSSEELSVLDQTKTMGTSNVIDNEKTSESTLPENYIIDKLTTVKIEPEQNTDIQSTNYETSSKPELVETTSEEELPITVKVNIDGEDKTFAYTTEPYAQTIKEISTNLHEDKTEKYAPTAHSADEFFTTSEKYQTFSHKYHDYTTIPESFVTQKSESETQSPLSLSTEKQSYFTTEEQQINDGQIDNTPDHNKYITKPDDTSTTELPASIITTRDDYSKPVTDTKDEHTDTTPYLVELEEHTHKRPQEVSSEIYNEMEVSTVKYDTSFSDIDEDGITTEKQLLAGHESQTDSSIKETADTSKEDIDVTTPFLLIDKKDILQTTTMTHDVVTESSTQFEKLTTPSSLVVHTENDVQTTSILTEKVGTTFVPEVITVIYENEVTPKQEEPSVVTEKEKESDEKAHTPYDSVTSSPEITTLESELVSAVANKTTIKSAEDAITLSPIPFDKFTRPEDKPTESVPSLSTSELHKPGFNEMLPTDDIPSTDEDNHFPPTGSSGYGQEPDYGEEDQAFGPGTCRYGGKVYVSAQQIPRDDPCDFCFCFRSDIICLQQSCPPPIHGCHEEPIQGFCCPRYECPVSMAMTLNITTTTTTTTTTLPPHFLPHAYKGAAQRRGCQIKGHTYKVGEVVRASSGPCLHCTCGGDGQMKCDPKACTPEPILRQMIAAAVSARRRR